MVKLGEIVERSFEFHGEFAVDTTRAKRAHDWRYMLDCEALNLNDVLGRALDKGYRPDLFRQTHGDRENAHLRLTKDGKKGSARLTSEPGVKADDVVYRLYVPVEE